MTIVPWMWGIWGVLAIFTAAVYLYRARLSRDEDDQLFLDDSFEQEKSAQAALTARIAKVQPVLTVALWLMAVATVFVIGYYIWDIMAQFK